MVYKTFTILVIRASILTSKVDRETRVFLRNIVLDTTVKNSQNGNISIDRSKTTQLLWSSRTKLEFNYSILSVELATSIL